MAGARDRQVADPWRSHFERVALGGVAVAAASYTGADPDLWGHLRFGLDMLATRSLSSVDPYSFTSDLPWVNHEWLAEVVMGAIWQVAGSAGIVLLKVALLAATWAPIDLVVRDSAPRLRRITPLLVLVALLPWVVQLRPQNFSFALFCWLLYFLHASRSRPSLLWWTPALFVLWVNLHGGWLVGGLTMAVWSAGTLFDRTISWVRRLLPLQTGAVSLSATLMNPYGWRMWHFLTDTIEFGRADITDWQPVYRLNAETSLVGLLWAVCAVAGVALSWRSRRPSVASAISLVALGIAGFQVSRITGFFALATVTLALPLLITAGTPRKSAPLPARQAVIGMALCVAIPLVALYWNASCVRMHGRWLPDVKTGCAILTLPPGRILTYFDWGEYAIWHRGRELLVSMDGRRETVYSPQVMQAHDVFYSAEPGGTDYPDAIGADYIWIPTRLFLASQLRDRGWFEFSRSDNALLLTRRSVAAAPEASGRPTPAGERCFPGP